MSSAGRIDPMASSKQREILLGEAASLDDQEYLELMEQLTDFNSSKPKCRLVHELSNHISKEESLLSTPEANSLQNRNRKIKQANLKQLKSSSITDQRVDRCSSLQDLADTASPHSQGSHARKKSSKSKRANSFSADSKSQIKVKSGQNNKRNSKTQPSSPCPPDLSNNSNKKTAKKDCNYDHSGTHCNISSSSSSSATNCNGNSGTLDNYHTSSVSNHKQSYSINTIDCDAQVEFALGDSSSTQPPHSSLSCDHSTVNSTGVTRPQQSTNYSSTSNADDTGEGILESQDYRRRLQLVNVNCLKENQSDTLFKLSNLVTGPLCESNCRSMSGVDKLFDQKDNNGLLIFMPQDSEIASLTASSNRQSTHQNKANLKKKKKQDVPSQKAENIPGHIGYKDVDFLAQYVIGMDGKLDSVARGKDKKSSNGTKKRPERSRSQQTDLPEKDDSDDDEEKASSSSQLSPKHSSSLQVEDLNGRHAFSDDEKGYCSDQESGFQVMRSKNRRYNRHNRLPMTKGYIVNKVPVQTTSLSKTPSITSGTSVSLNSRGYDSERECNYSEESVKKKPLRRKSISSVPHSQENSAENSDVDSSLSLPTAALSGAGRISYAQIAKSTLVQSQVHQSSCLQTAPAVSSKQHQSIGKRTSHAVKSAGDGETRSSSVNALAAGIVATASEITDITSPVSMCTRNSLNEDKCKQPLKTSASCSEIAVTCSLETSPSPLLKQNSAPEAKCPVNSSSSNNNNLPPVIICGDVARNANTESDAQFTFGFFDDVIEEDNCCNSNSSSGNSSASCSPEGNQEKSIVTLTSDHHQDVHLSFNYNEVLAYIRKAWVNSERTMQMQALSASEKSSWA